MTTPVAKTEVPMLLSDDRSLRFFVRLARQGAAPGSSTSEQACRELARLIVQRVPYFGDATIDGLIDFIRCTKAAPQTAEELIEF